MALLFDGTYQQAVEQCLAGQPPAGTGTLALACARSPPPATLLASTLGLLSAPVDLEAVQLPAALAAAGRAVGACSALAALAPSAAEGVACFAAVAGWLLEVAGSMQDPQWYRHAARAKELWAQLAAVAARLMACLDLLLRQWQLPEAEGEDDGSSGGQWLMALQAAGGSSGSASEAAKRTAAQVVTLRAMCHFMAGRLGATGGSSGSAAAGSDAGQVAQAVQDLRRLAPFGVAGQAELMAGTPQDSIQASPDSARSFQGLCKALEQQRESAGLAFCPCSCVRMGSLRRLLQMGEELLAAQGEGGLLCSCAESCTCRQGFLLFLCFHTCSPHCHHLSHPPNWQPGWVQPDPALVTRTPYDKHLPLPATCLSRHCCSHRHSPRVPVALGRGAQGSRRMPRRGPSARGRCLTGLCLPPPRPTRAG